MCNLSPATCCWHEQIVSATNWQQQINGNELLISATSFWQQNAGSRGVQLAKSDFGSVFGLVLQKNCSCQFGFNFTKLTAVSVLRFGFCTVCCLMCMHCNDVLLC